MLIINEKEIQQSYGMKDAIRDVKTTLHAYGADKIDSPHRTVLRFPQHEGSALYMPSADLSDEVSAVKVVTIFPKNPSKGKATTQGVLLLSDAENGEHLAMMNASYLTRLRTGALSGIATKYLARKDAQVLTIIGTGGMGFEQALGVLAVRNVERILLVNRTPSKAEKFGEKLQASGIDIPFEVYEDVAAAIRQSDIICGATRSNEPVFNGDDLKPGTHINGIGSYLPHMREVDSTTITRASKIIVDDLGGAKDEAGELIHAANEGSWSFDDLHGELFELENKLKPGRESEAEITFFKSVGAAYFDLSVAKGVYDLSKDRNIGTEFEI
ncbi:ornithine cyclodeaminase family protein [Alkalihalobacillus sp. TS-13]|uniref:ornithine cyclodeaminase family protein n=1 Tax=Alkalihalobacillus sp. TS-13 TaxID=2842455 RepID=UPI001C86EB27|nr:ornithine cyclodeaminase family protein [Alkalihalobacillus sp. TS-13]